MAIKAPDGANKQPNQYTNTDTMTHTCTKVISKSFFSKAPFRVMIKAAPCWPFHIRQSGRQPALQGAGSGRIHEDEDDGENDDNAYLCEEKNNKINNNIRQSGSRCRVRTHI